MQQLLFVSFVSGHDKKTGNKTIHIQRSLSIYYGLAGYLLWGSGTSGNPKNRPKSSFNVNKSVMGSRHNDVVLIYTGSFKRSSYSKHRLLHHLATAVQLCVFSCMCFRRAKTLRLEILRRSNRSKVFWNSLSVN